MHECFVWFPAVGECSESISGSSPLAGVEDEDEEVNLLALSSLLSPRSLDRLGINDRWDVSSSKSFESRVRLDPDER
jgi:hypothetical protein